MQRFLYSLVAAAIVSLAALAPAKALTPATAGGVLSALQETRMAEEVRYVCRHRRHSSRRACWWQPPPRHIRPYYRPHRPHYYHRPYRPHRPHHHHRRWR